MGAETRIAVAEDIVLDFAGLFSPIEGKKQAPESPVEPLLGAGEYKTITEPQKPVEGLKTGLQGIPQKEPPEQAKILLLNTQREREDHQRSLEVYRHYQENIKAELTARNAEEMTVDVYKIRWTKVTSSRFDTTSFKKAMPELYGQFTKTSESRRFSIA